MLVNPKTKRRIGLAVVFTVVAVCGVFALQTSTYVQVQYSSWRFRNASSEQDRLQTAESLAALGKTGLDCIVVYMESDNTQLSEPAAKYLVSYVDKLSENNDQQDFLITKLVGHLAHNTTDQSYLVMQFVPVLLKKTEGKYSDVLRRVVSSALGASEHSVRLFAIKLSLHPHIKTHSELLPLLHDSNAEIRQAALFAVTSNNDELMLSDEELFEWLHDSDASVRKVCLDALLSRNRSEFEIALGSRLTHPNPLERLRLLLDLRYDEVADPEPWLERLSHDPEPAIRVGAARVIIEVARTRNITLPQWTARMVASDEDPTVRRVANYYLGLRGENNPGNVRPVSAP